LQSDWLLVRNDPFESVADLALQTIQVKTGEDRLLKKFIDGRINEFVIFCILSFIFKISENRYSPTIGINSNSPYISSTINTIWNLASYRKSRRFLTKGGIFCIGRW
jgi:hypothetical protein